MIYLVGSNSKFSGVKTIVLNEIVFFDLDVNLADFNAIVLTSKNSINALKNSNINPDKNLEIYAIGDTSSKAANDFGFTKIYTAKNSHGNEFAMEIAPFLIGKKVLFLRAKHTSSDVFEILKKSSIDIKQIIAYENVAKTHVKEPKPQKHSVIIFSAPSAVRNFKANFDWDSTYKAVAIGNTTAQELSSFCKPYICKIQSIKECIKLAKTLF